jgi:hypothetical protein
MVHFTAILPILFSTSLLWESTANENQAALEGSCDSPLKGRVALQKGSGHKLESVKEEVPDVWFDGEGAMKKKNSLTQSGHSRTSKWWRKRTSAPTTSPPTDKTFFQKIAEWVINDFKFFEKLLGRGKWMALGHKTQTKIIESGPEDVDRVLGDEFNKLPDDVQRKLKKRTGLLQVFSQKQALTEGRHADLMQALTESRHTEMLQVSNLDEKKFVGFFLKLFLKMDFVVERYAKLLKLLGDKWDKVPTFIQAIIVPKLCGGAIDAMLHRLRARVKDEELLDQLKKMVEQAFDEICES